MKKLAFMAVLVLLLAMPAFTAFASEQGDGNLSITVVVPPPSENQTEQTVQVSQAPVIYHVYPVHVWESRENGRREIIRVYELHDNESPTQIPREPFERDGFRFELAEIVRREIPTHSTIDHVETIEVSTQANDLESVLRLLSPTIEYLREDGYFGVLALDISSIQIQSQGTTSSNFTATRTREFPHLSSPDTALVPRTITDGGRNYNLANVEWRTQTSDAVDYRQVANTFTAVATYTRVGTRVSTIGYTTTAEYRGQISRIATGRTEFTAHFIGIPVVIPTVTVGQPEGADCAEAEISNQPPVIENVTVEQVHIGGIVIETETVTHESVEADPADHEEVVEEDEDDETSGFPIGNALIALLVVGGMVFAYFLGKKGIAMFKAMRKPACMLLACGFLLGATVNTAYAAEIPRYGFGAHSSESAVHMDGRHEAQHSHQAVHFNRGTASPSADTVHFHPRASSQNAGGAIHFAPNRASPVTVTPAGYNYGERLGVLTVERTGRRINVIAGATMEAMDFGAGHFSFTGLNYGNTALVGHNRGRTNGFFDFVRHLRKGDILTLEAGGITRSYAVAMMHTISYTDFSPLAQFGDHRLTLITCVEYQRTQRRVAVAVAAQ